MKRVCSIIFMTMLCMHNISAEKQDLSYELIRSIVEKYKRPITILDFGAGDGKHSLKIAQEFPKAVCVMVDNNNTLLSQCQNKNLSNIIYLNKHLNIKELLSLSECEHFDIIILGKVLHQFNVQWTDAFRAFREMGDHLIIENPPIELNTPSISNRTRRTIDRFFAKHTIPVLGTIKYKNASQPAKVYHVDTGTFHSIQRKVYPWKEKLPHHSHIIESSYAHKKLVKNKNGKISTRNWIPGINFFTFKMLNGQFPKKETLKKTLMLKNRNGLKSLTINNMIVQGANLEIINRSLADDALECPGPHSFFFDKHIEEILRMIEIYDTQEIAALCNFK